MNKLEALNVALEKQEHGVIIPMALKISVGGKWHTVTIDHEDKNVQKIVRVLVMMMLRSEVDRHNNVINRSEKLLNAVGFKAPSDYTVRVRIGPIWKEITVRAHSSLDARVMAFILSGDGCPDQAEQEVVIRTALANTEIVS